MSNIIDGKAAAAAIKEKLKVQLPELEEKYGRKPCLCVIIAGDNPASQIYVRNKVKAADAVGIESRVIELDGNVGEDVLLKVIKRLNDDDGVDGILVQLPLPEQIDCSRIINAISPDKDVDGFSTMNSGGLWNGCKCTIPCTPKGIMYLIHTTGIEISGKNAVIVGRSNIVGKPVAKLLLDENATVTIAHSRTPDLKEVTSKADILVVAAGRSKFIKADMIKPGAVVIDVGINRNPDGHLCGDVDFEEASKIAGWITPVPGGVGPMTIAMLIQNTFECFQNKKL